MLKKMIVILLSTLVIGLVLISCSDDSSPTGSSNIAPTASFTISPETGTVTSNFSFDASGSTDPEDSSSLLEVRWDFDGDGNYDTSWNVSKIETYTYSEVGTFSVKLAVKDTEGDEDTIVHDVTVSANSVNPSEMISIPAGSFEMGTDYLNIAMPVHDVTLTNNFEMGKYEVTNYEFCSALNYALSQGFATPSISSVSNSSGDSKELLDLDDEDCEISYDGTFFQIDAGKEYRPVIEVTWYGAAFYANMLSHQAGSTELYDLMDWSCNIYPGSNGSYRLPTEAEWEYVARYNDGRTYPWGQDVGHDYANYYINGSSNNINHSTDIGSYAPTGDSQLGLCDMEGNVYEWCNDWNDAYSSDSQIDPTGPDSGFYRISRGGSWDDLLASCNTSNRDSHGMGSSGADIGFRIVKM